MRVNGKNLALAAPTSLADFLQDADYNSARVVVERNGEIITAGRFADVQLADDDHLEIVQFVGGG
ncbi:MAG: sulfur carrier protein ThiS [Peptococcaceae bacterium]|nr:sulfur carrier protein ThiS [Peptococcaceae bacterium]